MHGENRLSMTSFVSYLNRWPYQSIQPEDKSPPTPPPFRKALRLKGSGMNILPLPAVTPLYCPKDPRAMGINKFSGNRIHSGSPRRHVPSTALPLSSPNPLPPPPPPHRDPRPSMKRLDCPSGSPGPSDCSHLFSWQYRWEDFQLVTMVIPTVASP